MFKLCWLNKGKVKRFMTPLRSKNHQIVVIRMHKIALKSYDDKRHLIMMASIHSHRDTTKIRESYAAMVNLFSILTVTQRSHFKTLYSCFSESEVSSLFGHSDNESDHGSSCYLKNILSDTDIDDSQRVTPATLHSFLQHHESFC